MFLSCDAEDLPQTGRVKLFYLLYMLLISCPRFTAIKEGGKNDSSVYLYFGGLRDASPIPHIPVESPKGCTCFCESGVLLVIYDDRLREVAAEVGELFLPASVIIPWWWRWAQCMVFQALASASLLSFWADVWAKIVSGHWELVNTVLHVGFGRSVQCTVVSEQKLVNDISLHLGLCLKPSAVKDSVSNVDSVVQAIKFIKQHWKKHDTKKTGDQDTSLLKPICDRKGYGAFPVVLHPCMHTVMKLSNDGDEFSWGSRILPWFSKARLCWPCQMPWSDQPKSSRDQFCSWHFSFSYLEANTKSTVQRSLRKPIWLSGKSSCSRWLLKQFRRTLARILPEIESK